MPPTARPQSTVPHTRWWLWPNVLSLDAPAIAVLWTWLFAACDRLHFGWGLYAVVFGVVWCVYVADRLIDVRRSAGGRAETARHAFYRRHWRIVLPLLVAVAAVTLWAILFRIPEIIVRPAAFATVLVVLYFSQNIGRLGRGFLIASTAVTALILVTAVGLVPLHPVFKGLYAAMCFSLVVLAVRGSERVRFGILPKELLCGIAFAVGAALPTFVYSARGWFDMFSSPPVWAFAGLCTLNCVGIAVAEGDADRENDEAALPQQLPGIERLFPLLVIAVAVIAFHGWKQAGWSDRSWPILASVLVGLAGCGILHAVRHRLEPAAHRVLADTALLGPLLVMPHVLARG